MGGHGGLNILPQKKWNVYNYDNRDIVQKDKKIHAQKQRKKYENDRKSKMQGKFSLLKEDDEQPLKKQQSMKQIYKKDSLLNSQFKRLAEENQHVNLFQHEQKIIENRQLLECQKLKEAQWLKDKDTLDYSSKFLGIYNDDAKIPWYAKTKQHESQEERNKNKNGKEMKKQRYDMEDLTDRIRIDKLKSKQYFKNDVEKLKRFQFEEQKVNDKKIMINEPKVVKREFNEDRERSRDQKYEFLKNRQKFMACKNQQKQLSSTNDVGLKNSHEVNSHQRDNKHQNQETTNNQEGGNLSQQKQKLPPINPELQELRLKRLKRQQKQRKKAQQLKRKLQQAISRN